MRFADAGFCVELALLRSTQCHRMLLLVSYGVHNKEAFDCHVYVANAQKVHVEVDHICARVITNSRRILL